MRNHEKPDAHRLADELAYRVHVLTRSFPKHELFGLTSQLRRAVVSVPSNVVEGRARSTTREYARFLEMAYGSCREVCCQLCLARRLEYSREPDHAEVHSIAASTAKTLARLVSAMATRM